MTTRDKKVLERLNPEINGINRFISKSIPPKKPLEQYSNFRSITWTNEKEILDLAEHLTQKLFKSNTYDRVTSGEDLLNSLESIFTNKEILFGNKNYIIETLSLNKVRLKSIYNSKQQLQFTILGYPHKMPNPLYTRSASVDFSEILSITKLYRIMELLNGIYPYGVKLTILTENSIFDCMSELTFAQQLRYFNDLVKWESLIDNKNLIEIVDIKTYHTLELEKTWKHLINIYTKEYESRNPTITDMIEAVLPTNFMTLNYSMYSCDFLLNLFNKNNTSERFESIREEYYKKALTNSFYYSAYHQARYKLNSMDKFFPDSLRLTVAPKVGSLGISMLNTSCLMLPYYGYIIVDKNSFTISYYIDIPYHCKAVYIESENNYPFYFLK